MKPYLRWDSDTNFRQVLGRTVERRQHLCMQDQKCIIFMTKKNDWTSDLRTPFKCNAKEGRGMVMLLLHTSGCRWFVYTSLYTCIPTEYLLCCTLALLFRHQQASMQSWTSVWAYQSMQPVFRHSSALLQPAAFTKLSSFSQWSEISR